MNLSKFQIITIMFLFMFVFVIGAIYTNTKDAAENKLREQNSINKYENSNLMRNNEQEINIESARIQTLSNQIDELNRKIQNLEQNGNSQNSDGNCRIYGIMDGTVDIQMSPSQAIQESRETGKDVVVLCKF